MPALFLVASAFGLLVGQAAPRPCAMRIPRAVRMAEMDKLTLTLTGCSGGIGVGLDDKNVVDMLKPGMPASKVLRMGDKLMQWNDQQMTEVVAGRVETRKLKDVVDTSRDSHTVVVERERKSWDTNYEMESSSTSWSENSWDAPKSW